MFNQREVEREINIFPQYPFRIFESLQIYEFIMIFCGFVQKHQ